MAQHAQAGYACDDCTKRQPMAFNEVKECCKGHQTLGEKLRNEPLNIIGKRHATKIMSEVENTKLRSFSKGHDVTAAESIKARQTEAFLFVRNT